MRLGSKFLKRIDIKSPMRAMQPKFQSLVKEETGIPMGDVERVSSQASDRSINLLIATLSERPNSPQVKVVQPAALVKRVRREIPTETKLLNRTRQTSTNAETNLKLPIPPLTSFLATPVRLPSNGQDSDRRQKIFKGSAFRGKKKHFQNRT